MSKRELIHSRAGNPTRVVRGTAPDKTSRGETRIVIETRAPDHAALSSAIREWIVPVLVRRYLTERVGQGSLPATCADKLYTEPFGEEQRG
jgi:hypothetical protein